MKKTIPEISFLTSGSSYIDFTEKTVGGKSFTLFTLIPQKRLVLLDFWASWCGPCIREMPRLRDLYNEYRDKGLEIVGISLDSQESAWKGAIKANEIPWIRVIGLTVRYMVV